MKELIFTSAPFGLAHGRSGFTTVARHSDLRERIVLELEKISTYDPPTNTRPVIFTYRILTFGSDSFYIISRYADAPPDYTGRTNFIAHHLIFEKEEILNLLPPAEIALRYQAWRNAYTEAPKFLNPIKTPENFFKNGESLLPAIRWKAFCGSAKKATLLCPKGKVNQQLFVSESFFSHKIILGLFAESAALSNDSLNGWGIPFSTVCFSENSARDFTWKVLLSSSLSIPNALLLEHPESFPNVSINDSYEKCAEKGGRQPNKTTYYAQNVNSLNRNRKLPKQYEEESESKSFFNKKNLFSPLIIFLTFLFFGLLSVAIVFLILKKDDTTIKASEKTYNTQQEIKKPSTPFKLIIDEASIKEINEFNLNISNAVELQKYREAADTVISFQSKYPIEAKNIRKNILKKIQTNLPDDYIKELNKLFLVLSNDFSSKNISKISQVKNTAETVFKALNVKLNKSDIKTLSQIENRLQFIQSLQKQSILIISSEEFKQVKKTNSVEEYIYTLKTDTEKYQEFINTAHSQISLKTKKCLSFNDIEIGLNNSKINSSNIIVGEQIAFYLSDAIECRLSNNNNKIELLLRKIIDKKTTPASQHDSYFVELSSNLNKNITIQFLIVDTQNPPDPIRLSKKFLDSLMDEFPLWFTKAIENSFYADESKVERVRKLFEGKITTQAILTYIKNKNNSPITLVILNID